MSFSKLPFMPLLLLLCTALFAQQKSTLTDTRDGKTYKTVKIGEQVWLAENLNYAAGGSKCYNNEPANCKKYGRLYDWETAIKACPKSWHLPSEAEWTKLADFVGDSSTAGTKLKATSGWYSKFNGTDEYGFAALPGGNGNSDGSFDDAGDYGFWWSASEDDSSYAYIRGMLYDYEYALYGNGDKSYLFSVRCVKDQ